MEYPKEIYVKDYFEIHKYYSEIYGNNRVIIIMQVGSFHEAYCTETEGLDLINLAQQLNIVCTKKNNNLSISISNPRMMGFPTYVTYNYIDKLIDLNYTIVLIDQTTEPPNPIRKVTGIFSPATYIDKKLNIKSFYLISLVIDKIKEPNKSYQLCIGISAYDLSTGEGSFYETYSKSSDILLGLDDALRFIEKYPPREIILENKLLESDLIFNMKVDEILAYLNINIKETYKINIKDHEKLPFQMTLLNNIYKIETNINIIEYIGLQFLNWARLSLILLLDYTLSHQPNLLEHLKIPILYSSNKYLYLGNRALEQLDIINNHETSLFNIINYTKTTLGKRYLFNNITLPLIESNILIKRYNTIEILLESNYQDKLIKYLNNIYDLDKLIRKIEINKIIPYELYQLYISFHKIYKLVIFLKNNNLLKLFELDINDIDTINNLLEFIKNKYILEKINECININNMDTSFYNKNIYIEIDELQNKIDNSQNFMNNLINILENNIINQNELKNKLSPDDKKSLISLKYNDKDGFYLLITNKRCEILKNNLKLITCLKIGDIKLDIKELEFIPLPKSLNTKIFCNKLKIISNDINNYKNDMIKLMKDKFYEDINFLFINYDDFLHKISNKIAYIDFINSGALCAINNHYTKPILNEKKKSYFIAKQLRHPIVEKINNIYIPHDIELGYETKQNGILLYGINSSGKSTLMKSIGINIILAQIGYYTASTYFEYSPYSSLFTRISGNDNLFRGLSSFMVEMMELMNILKRNNQHTMIIGDEICSKTEIISGTVIVCYMLESLAKSNSSFITATHLHQIANLDSVKKIETLKTKHLKITYDNINDLLIYDRNLLDGHGETFYGLQVAKYLMKDINFNDRTTEILKEYNNIEIKKSKYNSNLYLQECNICKSKNNLETHHIIHQSDFNEKNIYKNNICIQKNGICNLVSLCESCHTMCHSNKITINGWIETSEGIKLDYIKENDKIIKYIYKLKNKLLEDKDIKHKIKDKFNIIMSLKEIRLITDKFSLL
jgi:DNA mismatch repair protein MutS